MKKGVLLVVAMMMLIMANVACASGKKGSAVEGKVVNLQGKPLAGVKVVATQAGQVLKGYERIESKTKTDGTFILKGLYPRAEYNLSFFEGGQCHSPAVNLHSASAGETQLIGAIALRFEIFKALNDAIISDPRTGLEWTRFSDHAMLWEDAKQYVQKLSHGGGGWQLPTVIDLSELDFSSTLGCGLREELWGGVWESAVFGPKRSGSVWASETCNSGWQGPGAAGYRFNHYGEPYFRHGEKGGTDCSAHSNQPMYKQSTVLAVRYPPAKQDEIKQREMKLKEREMKLKENLLNAEKILVGKWRDQNSLTTFNSDGTYHTVYDDRQEQTGLWQVQGDLLLQTIQKVKFPYGEWDTANTKKTYKITDIDTNTYIVKQGSKEWKAMRVQSE